MDRSSSAHRSKDNRRRSAFIFAPAHEKDDTFRESGEAPTDTFRRKPLLAHPPTGTSPATSIGRDTILPGISQPHSQASSQPSSPQPSRRKRLGMSRPVIPSILSSEDEKRNGGSSGRSARPQTSDMSEHSRAAETLSQWRIGRSRRRSSGEGTARPKSAAIASLGNLGIANGAGSVASPQSLKVQTQPSQSRSSNKPQRSRSVANSHALALLNGASPLPEARKMLALMKEKQGRMHGNCMVQESQSDAWTMAQCSVDPRKGALVWTPISVDWKGDKILIRNLRGCRVQAMLDPDGGLPQILVRGLDMEDRVRLQPESQSQFEQWFAAFLCWQPVQPSENPTNQGEIRRLVALPFRAGPTRKTNEKANSRKDAAIIKVGKLLYLDPDMVDSEVTPVVSKPGARSSSPAPLVHPPWRRVSCILRESGELILYTTTNLETLATIRLSRLTRSAVQRLHPSMFGMDHCTALYPQYSDTTDACSRVRPIYLSFETRVLFEVWFALFRAFTVPEIYGAKELAEKLEQPLPRSPAPEDNESLKGLQRQISAGQNGNRYSAPFLPGLQPDVQAALFRVERTLQMQVGEARFRRPEDEVQPDTASGRLQIHGPKVASPFSAYVRVLLDGQTKAKTSAKADHHHPFWYESFELIDLGPVLPHLHLQVKLRSNDTLSPMDVSTAAKPSQRPRNSHSYLTDYQDPTLGELSIDLSSLASHKDVDKWWPLQDRSGRSVGEISLKLRIGEEIILMDTDYCMLEELLLKFENTLTLQIAERVPSELARLAEILLNIFQASGRADVWFEALAEEEIDGIRKEAPPGRLRMDSSDTHDSRESVSREQNKSAMAEANLLFRGNSLLSKALDLHMKRLGKEYLEETIGAKIRMIAESDADCEVDPVKLGERGSLQQNWNRLIAATDSVWRLIADSPNRCPMELRRIFRYIRHCAEDRYGELMRSVRYSSVSGFLFLRFFCPAVLNPRLFGLLRDNPSPRTQRTFTLIAKSLQGLANQAPFGTKEPWMKPMNAVLDAHRHHFKDFIDTICSIPPDGIDNELPASYSAPRAIFSRLPQSSKEGFPKVPYLIDHCRNLSALVNLWMDNLPGSNHNRNSTFASQAGVDENLRHFHKLCTELRLRTQYSLGNAERTEHGVNALSERWNTIGERMEQNPEEFYISSDSASPSSPIGGEWTPPDAIANTPAGMRSPNPSAHNTQDEVAPHSPVDRDDSQNNHRYDDIGYPTREPRRGRPAGPVASSPYLSHALSASANNRSTPSVLLSDTGGSTNGANHSANSGASAPLSRAPSRAPSSIAASSDIASLSDMEKTESGSTVTPRKEGRRKEGRRKERSESRFTLFGRRKREPKVDKDREKRREDAGSMAGRSLDLIDQLRVSYQGPKA